MITLRLQRIGRRNDPHFRVVATDSKNSAKTGKFIEVVGTYTVKQGTFTVDAPRLKHWISVGAQTSNTLHNLLLKNKIIEGKPKRILPAKKKEAKKK